jgi:hypothetical protein
MHQDTKRKEEQNMAQLQQLHAHLEQASQQLTATQASQAEAAAKVQSEAVVPLTERVKKCETVVTDVFSTCEDVARTLGPIMESITLAREEQVKVANTMKESEERHQGRIDEEIGRRMRELDLKLTPKSEADMQNVKKLMDQMQATLKQTVSNCEEDGKKLNEMVAKFQGELDAGIAEVKKVHSDLDGRLFQVEGDVKRIWTFAPTDDDVSKFHEYSSKIQEDRKAEEEAFCQLLGKIRGVCNLLDQVGDATAEGHGFVRDADHKG